MGAAEWEAGPKGRGGRLSKTDGGLVLETGGISDRDLGGKHSKDAGDGPRLGLWRLRRSALPGKYSRPGQEDWKSRDKILKKLTFYLEIFSRTF